MLIGFCVNFYCLRSFVDCIDLVGAFVAVTAFDSDNVEMQYDIIHNVLPFNVHSYK